MNERIDENWVNKIRSLYESLIEESYAEEKEEEEKEINKHYYIPPKRDDEEYRTIRINPNYEVSNYGNVRNKITGRNLKPYMNRYGYMRVGFKDTKGRYRNFNIHRLEANAFLDATNTTGLRVNHKDGKKDNNHISNLEWCTPKENVQHAYRNGLVHNTEETGRKHREVFRKIYPPVRCLENGKVYPDAGVAAKDLGCNQLEIRKVTRGVYKTHKGYHFENADWSEINVTD